MFAWAREDGIGKRTPFEDYRLISRGGTGVIAIDLPSGVETDTGEASPYAILADETVTFICPKIGIITYPGRKYTGEIHVDPIGLEDQDIEPGICLLGQQRGPHARVATTHDDQVRGRVGDERRRGFRALRTVEPEGGVRDVSQRVPSRGQHAQQHAIGAEQQRRVGAAPARGRWKGEVVETAGRGRGRGGTHT